MSLKYTEIALSPYEVPGEISICIYISGCSNKCEGCHYPELQNPDSGELLSTWYVNIVELYSHQATCVCFLGEGKGTSAEQAELNHYSDLAHERGLKSCLYSGRVGFI